MSIVKERPLYIFLSGLDVKFAIKILPSTCMRKVMARFHSELSRSSQVTSDLVFILKRNKTLITPMDTPISLGMLTNDTILVSISQSN